MSICERCGATFHCAMTDGNPAAATAAAATTEGGTPTPCWCTLLPPAVPVPRQEGAGASGAPASVGCWCPDCLRAHIAALDRPHS